jgi:hypothetical protein
LEIYYCIVPVEQHRKQERSTMTTTTMNQENILRTLVQGEEGREWADERTKGWSSATTDKGE